MQNNLPQIYINDPISNVVLDHFPMYEISPYGIIYSHYGIRDTIKWHYDDKGYHTVALRDLTGLPLAMKVHRLVAFAFIPNIDPDYYIQVNHINGDKDRNDVWNLEWMTNLQNMRHSYEIGLRIDSSKGSNNGRAIINEDDVEVIRQSSLSYSELGKIYGLSKSGISSIKNRKTWAHVK